MNETQENLDQKVEVKLEANVAAELNDMELEAVTGGKYGHRGYGLFRFFRRY